MQIIKKYRLDSEHIAQLLISRLSLKNIWSINVVENSIQYPELLQRIPPRYLNIPEIDLVDYAYRQVGDLLPDQILPKQRQELFNKLYSLIEQQNIRFDSEHISELVGKEVVSVDELFTLFELEPEFRLNDELEVKNDTVEIPLLLYGNADAFVAFDQTSNFLTPDLQVLKGEKLRNAFLDRHFLYTRNGQLEFGSINSFLTYLTEDAAALEFISTLQKNGVSNLTRVLPVFWDGDTPLMEMHTLRIASAETTALLIIEDEDGSVEKVYALVLPPHSLSELNRVTLKNELHIKDGQEIQILLPDAAVETVVNTSTHGTQLLTDGTQPAQNQSLVFTIAE